MSGRPIDAVAAIGTASDPGTWSGIPYHFLAAGRRVGWEMAAWPLDLVPFRWKRRWWNLGRLLAGRGSGGFQYSQAFLDQAESNVPPQLWQGRVLTFNQHFPRAHSVAVRGGRLLNYVDATFASFCAPGGLGEHLPIRVKAEACLLERENYRANEKVVTMARWAAESAVRLCGVPRAKVATILPGANVDLPAGYPFPVEPGRPGRDRPLVLGFVGKDWERKGLPFLLDVRLALERCGVRAVVRCVGHTPRDLGRLAGVEFAGFIDKTREPDRFVAFLAGCDVGCLFSRREPLGVSTLEFLHAGIPVAGFLVEGLADTLPPDAGFRFLPSVSAAEVAETLRETFSDEGRTGQLRANARAWSPRVTWERCLREWQELLATGTIKSPVQPWRGLRAA